MLEEQEYVAEKQLKTEKNICKAMENLNCNSDTEVKDEEVEKEEEKPKTLYFRKIYGNP